jgi:hypothetical protein
MTPLPLNPKVLILIDPKTGERLATASNIDPKLFVNITDNPDYFKEQAKGLPFNELQPN